MPRKDISSPPLGGRVRALRKKRGWSLASLSAKTGLAISTLSRIENNQLSARYENLVQLSRGLEVDLSELLGSDQDEVADVTMGRLSHTKPGSGRVVEAETFSYLYLSTDLKNKKMTPMIGTVSAQSFAEAGGYLRHPGEEVVYVLEGTLDLHTEFYEPVRVEEGACVYFDSTMGHAFVAVGKPVKILSVCTTAEPQLMETAGLRATATSPLAANSA